MKRVEVALLGEETNAAVVQLPLRHFPGLVIQGDSLSILCSHARGVVASLSGGTIDDATEGAIELRDMLDGYQAAYERAMTAAGLALPYARRSGR